MVFTHQHIINKHWVGQKFCLGFSVIETLTVFPTQYFWATKVLQCYFYNYQFVSCGKLWQVVCKNGHHHRPPCFHDPLKCADFSHKEVKSISLLLKSRLVVICFDKTGSGKGVSLYVFTLGLTSSQNSPHCHGNKLELACWMMRGVFGQTYLVPIPTSHTCVKLSETRQL